MLSYSGSLQISALIKSKDIVAAFRDKYKNSVGVISGERKNPYLAAVTVTSALGRSSVYNRLTLNSKKIFTPIGMTQGWGHFHVSDDLFLELVDYLKSIDDVIHGSYDYGAGANWRIRILKKGLSTLGLNPGLMKHGSPNFAGSVTSPCAIRSKPRQVSNKH
mgnify:CR=1 FL=1